MTSSSSRAPDNLGVGRTIDESVTLTEIQALWGNPTRRENIAPIPGAPGRVILTYAFPEARLEARMADMSAAAGYQTRKFDVIRFHFETSGSLIFMEQGSKTNLPEAIGGDIESVKILPGEGHYLESPRC